MRSLRLAVVLALFSSLGSSLGIAACDAKKDGPAADPATDAAKAKILGTWIDAEGDEVYELTDGRFTSKHTKLEGSKLIQGTYTVVKAEGDTITIRPSLDMGDGKSLVADDQIITVIDADTMERHNAKNGSGGKFTRKKG